MDCLLQLFLKIIHYPDKMKHGMILVCILSSLEIRDDPFS